MESRNVEAMVHRYHVSEFNGESIFKRTYRNLDAVGLPSNLIIEAAWLQGAKILHSPCESMSLGNPESLIEKSPREQA